MLNFFPFDGYILMAVGFIQSRFNSRCHLSNGSSRPRIIQKAKENIKALVKWLYQGWRHQALNERATKNHELKSNLSWKPSSKIIRCLLMPMFIGWNVLFCCHIFSFIFCSNHEELGGAWGWLFAHSDRDFCVTVSEREKTPGHDKLL